MGSRCRRCTIAQAAHVRSVGVWDTVARSIGLCVALNLDDLRIERVIGVAVSHSRVGRVRGSGRGGAERWQVADAAGACVGIGAAASRSRAMRIRTV